MRNLNKGERRAGPFLRELVLGPGLGEGSTGELLRVEATGADLGGVLADGEGVGQGLGGDIGAKASVVVVLARVGLSKEERGEIIQGKESIETKKNEVKEMER